MFPNSSSVTRPSPSLLPGSDGTPSPAFMRYYETATTAVVSRPAPPHLPALDRAALWLTSRVRSSRPGSRRPARRGCCDRFHPFPVFGPQGTCGSPKFPENPSVPLPCSQTPAEPRCLAFAALRCCPPASERGRPRRPEVFGALSHGLSTGCLRFVPPLLTTTQNSLPGDGHSFPGGIPVYPQSSLRKSPPFGFRFPWALLGAI